MIKKEINDILFLHRIWWSEQISAVVLYKKRLHAKNPGVSRKKIRQWKNGVANLSRSRPEKNECVVTLERALKYNAVVKWGV